MNQGWQTRPFDDCIDPVVYTTKVQRKDFLPEGAYPVVSQEESFINGYWDHAQDVFSVDRPVVVFGDHTRTLKYVDFDFVLGADGVKVLKPKPFLHPKFFFYQLHTAKLDSLGYARHYRLLKEHAVAYPGYGEQQRIVALLDEALDGLAAAKANAEKNLQNAQDLFETNLHAAFSQIDEATTLAECATDISDGDHAPPPKSSSGVPFITISNVDKESRCIDFSDTFTVPREYFEALKPHRRPKAGDVLYTVTGSFGIPILVADDTEFCFQRHIGLIRPKPGIDSQWLEYALLSPQVRAQAEAGATGTAQRTVALGTLRKMTIPKVSIEQQRVVAAHIAGMSVAIDRLKETQRIKLAALDELKKSLLHQAFSGAL